MAHQLVKSVLHQRLCAGFLKVSPPPLPALRLAHTGTLCSCSPAAMPRPLQLLHGLPATDSIGMSSLEAAARLVLSVSGVAGNVELFHCRLCSAMLRCAVQVNQDCRCVQLRYSEDSLTAWGLLPIMEQLRVASNVRAVAVDCGGCVIPFLNVLK